jgi:pantoate kinase
MTYLGKYGYAYFPSALSSIFSPKLQSTTMDGGIYLDKIGARGGGFSLVKGSETWVKIYPDESDRTEVVVNKSIRNFPPSIEAAEEMRRRYKIKGRIEIKHRISVPIGSGFGTSASSAAGVILAISSLLGQGITLSEVVRITHEVELRCRTGLNSEVGLMTGGLVLVLREGAPPRSIIDNIPLPSNIKLVAIVSGPIETPSSLSEISKIEEVEKIGDRYLSRILRQPTIENFLKYAREFSYESGFVTKKVEEIFEVFDKLPVIGYAQNMLGEAVHALVYDKNLDLVVRSLIESFSDMELVVSDITSICNVYSKSIGTIELEQTYRH